MSKPPADPSRDRRPNRPTTDELAARIIVLEAMTMAALGAAIRFGRAAVPPEGVILILNSVKSAVRARMQQESERLSSGGKAEADRYLDYVLSEFSESLIPRKSDPGQQKDRDKD
jgi:hypothetical protein